MGSTNQNLGQLLTKKQVDEMHKKYLLSALTGGFWIWPLCSWSEEERWRPAPYWELMWCQVLKGHSDQREAQMSCLKYTPWVSLVSFNVILSKRLRKFKKLSFDDHKWAKFLLSLEGCLGAIYYFKKKIKRSWWEQPPSFWPSLLCSFWIFVKGPKACLTQSASGPALASPRASSLESTS